MTLAVGLLALLGIAGPQRLESLPTLCPFHALTGIACPTCGLTRSLSAAARGDFGASLDYHPAGLVLLLALPLVIAACSWKAGRFRPVAVPLPDEPSR